MFGRGAKSDVRKMARKGRKTIRGRREGIGGERSNGDTEPPKSMSKTSGKTQGCGSPKERWITFLEALNLYNKNRPDPGHINPEDEVGLSGEALEDVRTLSDVSKKDLQILIDDCIEYANDYLGDSEEEVNHERLGAFEHLFRRAGKPLLGSRNVSPGPSPTSQSESHIDGGFHGFTEVDVKPEASEYLHDLWRRKQSGCEDLCTKVRKQHFRIERLQRTRNQCIQRGNGISPTRKEPVI